jgi:ABC-type Fe3+-hydroxamate transport system substrate-binding protein
MLRGNVKLPQMFRDVLGRTLTLTEPPRRVVSLVPSITETLFELGAGDAVVGVTDYCTFPETIDRPRVGGTKNPDLEAIRQLGPDLVHLNLEENLERHAREIEKFAPVFVSEPKSVGDVSALITTLGAIHGTSERAAEVVAALRRELTEMPAEIFTFACAIWKKPWMWCGGDTYVSNLIASAAGLNILHESARYPSIDLHSVLAMKPNIIFLPDEPFAFTAADAVELRSASEATVIGPFPGHLFTWHGTRTIQGLRFLREAVRK